MELGSSDVTEKILSSPIPINGKRKRENNNDSPTPNGSSSYDTVIEEKNNTTDAKRVRRGSPLKKKNIRKSGKGENDDEVVGAFLLTSLQEQQQSLSCKNCETTSTPLWRKGWIDSSSGKTVSLCNACGLKYSKNQFCPYCKYIYKMNQDIHAQRRNWLNCGQCKRWVHAECERKFGAKQIPPVVVVPPGASIVNDNPYQQAYPMVPSPVGGFSSISEEDRDNKAFRRVAPTTGNGVTSSHPSLSQHGLMVPAPLKPTWMNSPYILPRPCNGSPVLVNHYMGPPGMYPPNYYPMMPRVMPVHSNSYLCPDCKRDLRALEEFMPPSVVFWK